MDSSVHKASGVSALLVIAAAAAGFYFGGIALTGLLLCAFGLAVTWPKLGQGLPVWRGMLPWLMLAWLLWLALSIWWSSLPFISWFYFWAFAGMPIVFLAWQWLAEPDRVWAVVRLGMLAGAATLALWGIAQGVYWHGAIRLRGPLLDPNAYAATMNLFWFALCAQWWQGSEKAWRGVRPVLYLAVIFLITVSLFGAASRGATLAWLLLLPVMVWRVWGSPAFLRRLALLAGVALTGYLVAGVLVDYQLASAAHEAASGGSESVNLRLYMWETTLEMLKGHPWLGTGLGTWGSYYPAYRGTRDLTTAGYFAHNDYLQIAQEGGLVTLLLFLAVIAGLGGLAWRAITLRARPESLELHGLMLGVLAVSMHAAVNFVFYYAFVNVIIGLYAGRTWQVLGAGAEPVLRTSWLSRSSRRAMVAFFALLASGQLFLHGMAELLNCDHPVITALQRLEPRINEYEVARAIHAVRPAEPIPLNVMLASMRQTLADAEPFGPELERGVLQEVLEAYEQARHQWPTEPRYAAEQAKLLLERHGLMPAGDAINLAENIALAGLKADPRHAESTVALAEAQFLRGDKPQALNILAQAAPHAFRMRDRRLLEVAYVRMLVAPREIKALADMDARLRKIQPNDDLGYIRDANMAFYDQVGASLRKIVEEAGGNGTNRPAKAQG